MPYLYGSCPVAFTDLKEARFTHPAFNSGAEGTIAISTSADFVGFEAAAALWNTAIHAASGGDMYFSWNYSGSGICSLYSDGGEDWSLHTMPAAGFFGLGEYLDQDMPAGSTPAGALFMEGLSVDSVDSVASSDGREDVADSYSLIKGTVLNCTGYFKPTATRPSRMGAPGAGSTLDWAAWMGVISYQGSADASAWSLVNLDGKITDAQVIGHELQAVESFLEAEIWTVRLKVLVS